MQDLGWLRFLLPAIAGAAGVVLLKWLARRAKPASGRCYSAGWLIAVYLAGVAMFGTGLVQVLTQDDRQDGLNDEIWLPFVLAALFVLFCWAALDGFVRRIDWDDRTVTFRKPFWTPRVVAWPDITSIGYTDWTQSIRIGLKDGTGFAISEFMAGSQAFVMACEQNAPGCRLESED